MSGKKIHRCNDRRLSFGFLCNLSAKGHIGNGRKIKRHQWRIQGRGPGPPPPSLFLDQTEPRRAEKNFFLRPGPLISGSRWPSPTLPLPVPLIWRSGSANGHNIITRLFSIVGSPLASKIFTLEKILQLPPTNKQSERFTSCENFVLPVPDLTSPHPWHYLFSL